MNLAGRCSVSPESRKPSMNAFIWQEEEDKDTTARRARDACKAERSTSVRPGEEERLALAPHPVPG